MEWRCYEQNGSLPHVSQSGHGVRHSGLQQRGHTPLAARAFKSWTTLAEWGEGRSLALEVGALTAGGLCRRRDLYPAAVVILSAGCFPRDQDWDGLFKQDEATDSRGEGALLVGVPGRVRKVKMGSNQGVLDRAGVTRMLLKAIMEHLKPTGRIFPRLQGCGRAT